MDIAKPDKGTVVTNPGGVQRLRAVRGGLHARVLRLAEQLNRYGYHSGRVRRRMAARRAACASSCVRSRAASRCMAASWSAGGEPSNWRGLRRTPMAEATHQRKRSDREGAILAGCRAFYGYPITPASEIAEAAALYLPQVGRHFPAGRERSGRHQHAVRRRGGGRARA